jgi:hypothetical protein
MVLDTKVIAYRTDVQNFLTKFCVADRPEITDTVHKQMMLAHFYYIDYDSQGWYVLDDCDQFFREPTTSEWNIYAALWEGATAYE